MKDEISNLDFKNLIVIERYKITVKMHARSINIIIEPGMSVEMAAVSNPVTNQQPLEQLNNIFKATFGGDFKKMGCMNCGYLKVDKIG